MASPLDRTSLVAIVLLAAVSWSDAAVAGTPFEKQTEDAWINCVTSKVRHYYKGSDAADLIVRGSLAACRTEKAALLDLLYKNKSNNPSQTREVIELLESEISKDALLQVLELRIPK